LKTSLNIRGIEIEFDLAEGEAPPVLFLGIRKSGSTIFFKMCAAVCRRLDKNLVDIPGACFSRNIPANQWRNLPKVANLLQPGNCYSGFRAPPLCFKRSPHFREARKLLLVRDPRDALVSQYFSAAYSHAVPKKSRIVGARERLLSERERALEISVDDYVREHAGGFQQLLLEYQELMDGTDFTLLRYEDLIFDKIRLLGFIADALGGTLPEPFVKGVLGWADVVPDEERKENFIRKVTPGDHAVKLERGTIEFLNETLRDSALPFGYSL